uniref:Col_cuticle_N domain-containing protein n=1 Tax=Elaeophora elaphi TaxID=1147741 RepID=A0A0R3S3I1_9BILA
MNSKSMQLLDSSNGNVTTFLFGLAIFAPMVLFSSMTALIVSIIVITSRQFFIKENVQPFPTFVSYQGRVKEE